MSRDRESIADDAELIKDPELKAKRESENGIRQFNLAVQLIKDSIPDNKKSFKLKQSTILLLHKEALNGVHLLAGTYRNTPVYITKSTHVPPKFCEVADHISDMCDYILRSGQNPKILWIDDAKIVGD